MDDSVNGFFNPHTFKLNIVSYKTDIFFYCGCCGLWFLNPHTFILEKEIHKKVSNKILNIQATPQYTKGGRPSILVIPLELSDSFRLKGILRNVFPHDTNAMLPVVTKCVSVQL